MYVHHVICALAEISIIRSYFLINNRDLEANFSFMCVLFNFLNTDSSMYVRIMIAYLHIKRKGMTLLVQFLNQPFLVLNLSLNILLPIWLHLVVRWSSLVGIATRL